MNSKLFLSMLSVAMLLSLSAFAEQDRDALSGVGGFKNNKNVTKVDHYDATVTRTYEVPHGTKLKTHKNIQHGQEMTEHDYGTPMHSAAGKTSGHFQGEGH